jgi:hypothetical protein
MSPRSLRIAAALCTTLVVGAASVPANAQFLRGFDLFRAGKHCEAKEAWLKSEKSGDSTSPFGLAELYARGLCVRKDERIASRWYLTAALRGNARARAEIGQRYAYGKGVAPDALKAHVWMSTAKATAGGWESEFVETVEKNIALIEPMLTAEQRERSKAILATFKKDYRLPREFNSLD